MKSDVVKKGIERAPHRSLLRALGCSDKELGQPFIGVVNSFNEIVPGHMHLRSIAEAVKSGVRQAGGTPFEVNTIAVCDGIAMNHPGMKFSLPSRELIADSVEIVAQAHAFDALVFIPNCDKVVPGMLMAAVRLNVPAIFVSGGPMLAGRLDGQPVDVNTVFMAVGKAAQKKMTEAELTELEKAACPGCGSCAGMFTANTMNCLTEALGMALPGNGTIPAVDTRRTHLARAGGRSCASPPAGGHLPSGHHHQGRHLQRLCGGHGAGRQHQLRPPSHGHRPRGRRGLLADHGQRDQPPDAAPLQDQPGRGVPHRGPRPGRRRSGA